MALHYFLYTYVETSVGQLMFLFSRWGRGSIKYNKCTSWLLSYKPLNGQGQKLDLYFMARFCTVPRIGAGIQCIVNDLLNDSPLEPEVPLESMALLFHLSSRTNEARFLCEPSSSRREMCMVRGSGSPCLLWVFWVDSFNVDWQLRRVFVVVAINDDLHILVIYKMVATMHNIRNTLRSWTMRSGDPSV